MKNLFIKVRLLISFCVMTIGVQSQTATISILQAPCTNNGKLVCNTTGFIPPITFRWWYAKLDSTFTQTSATSDTLFHYMGGNNVTCYIQDNSGHGATASISVAAPFTSTVTITNPICPAVTGTCSVAMTGGTPPFSISWVAIPSGLVVGSASVVNFPAGGYECQVKDANGCYNVYSGYFDTLIVTRLSPISATVTTTVANCTNGTASVSASGGSLPYTYLWSNGANGNFVTGLSQGNIACTITDAQGCTANGYGFVTQGVVLGVNPSITNATCLANNGSVITFGSGGTPPYSYSYSNGQNTQTASGMLAGNYNVNITDAVGCTGSAGFAIGASTPISVTYSSTVSSCVAATGSSSLTITGGLAPYNVHWLVVPVQTGTVLAAVPPGTYNFDVTDANGCVQSGAAIVSPVSNYWVTVSGMNPTCGLSNGSAGVMVTGGVSPITYLWNTGASTGGISNLGPGTYYCVITDGMHCQHTKGVLLYRDGITLGFASTQASCIFRSDGAINMSIVGGVPPYQITWSNGMTGQNITGVPTNNYTVTVVDANGCVGLGFCSVGYNASNDSCYCTIKGTVYYDQNANCIRDNGEVGVDHIMINNNNTILNLLYLYNYTFTDTGGHYKFLVPSGTYNMQEVIQYLYPLSGCQSNTNTLVATASSGCTYTYNFANAINPLHDIHVWNASLIAPVPGNGYSQIAIVSNDGTIVEGGIQYGYSDDGQLHYQSTSGITLTQPNMIMAPNWYDNTSSMPLLNPGQSVAGIINYLVPTNIPLGTVVNFWDTVSYMAPMSNWLNDYTPWNNVRAFDTVVVGSFDPNFKEVSPRGLGPQGYIHSTDTVLDYIIHFQNTGTYNASKVVVLDTLDPNLDWLSLRVGYSNYNYVANVNHSGVLSFTFNNIQLPYFDPNYPLQSIGIICYSVHLKKNLVQGTQIKNSAAIYFDYNVPVFTNTTINTINNAAGVKEMAEGGKSLLLFPNPNSGSCTLRIQSGLEAKMAMVEVYSVEGSLVGNYQVGMSNGVGETVISTTGLRDGIYFIRINDGGTTRIIKMSVVH